MEQNKRSGRDAKRSYWGDHIAGWKQSGLSQQAYCRKHQLSLSSFGYWRSRLKRGGDDQARFHPVVLILTLNAQHLSEYLTSDIRIFCRRPPRACVA
jgi:hypothetical protein